MASHDESAPGALELVRAFVNAVDLDRDDKISTAPALRSWLTERGLLDPDLPVDQAGLVRAGAVRDALRTLAVANGGEGSADPALPVLREAAARGPLHVAFEPAGSRLEPARRDVDGALATLLAIVHGAMSSGDWERLKACKDPTCRWLYFDRSKNRSGAWCDMASCGNRAKARRRRAKAATS